VSGSECSKKANRLGSLITKSIKEMPPEMRLWGTVCCCCHCQYTLSRGLQRSNKTAIENERERERERETKMANRDREIRIARRQII